MSFTFRQFHIEQDKCAMKVGTDGVLLGSWAKGGKRILDIGTGTADSFNDGAAVSRCQH